MFQKLKDSFEGYHYDVSHILMQLSKKLSQLPATVSSLVTEVLEGAEKEYGGELVKVVLCCLYCSRTGWSFHPFVATTFFVDVWFQWPF